MPSICCSYPTVFLVEPENLVHHILKDMHTTKKKKTRVILRMLPISGTCKAFMEDMKKFTETFFEPWFKAPNKGTFQIVYKARNNSHLSREEVIKELAGTYGFHMKQKSLHAQVYCMHNMGQTIKRGHNRPTRLLLKTSILNYKSFSKT